MARKKGDSGKRTTIKGGLAGTPSKKRKAAGGEREKRRGGGRTGSLSEKFRIGRKGETGKRAGGEGKRWQVEDGGNSWKSLSGKTTGRGERMRWILYDSFSESCGYNGDSFKKSLAKSERHLID